MRKLYKKYRIEKRKFKTEKEFEDLNKWKRYLIVMGEKYLTKFGTLGESALTLDAFFKQKSLQSGKLVAEDATKDIFVDGDKGKGMVVDEDGSVSVNVRSDARGDVVPTN